MISPSGIPQFTGDFDQLDKDVSALRSDAIGIRNGGMDVHSRFQMLEAYYTAPEADALFATTQPVMDKADTFATKLETVADALDTFSIEARPLAERLKQLKVDAFAFVDSVEGDDDWTEDEDKVNRHRELLDGVTATQAAFQDAERRAASKISALVGGPEFVTDDGSHTVSKKKVMYGYDLDVLEHAKELPWGTPEEQTYEPWSLDWFGHGAKSFFWDGLYKDNIEAGVEGLWTLFGGNGSKAAGEAWDGLKDVVTGIGLYTITPYDAFMDWAVGPDKESADEIRAKQAAKEFAKSVVAWDDWKENPARASATVVFNVFTFGAGPFAVAAKTSKAGTVAKGAGIAAKIGEFIDPVSVGLKATGKAVSTLPKLSDFTSKIFAGAGASADAQRVHSVIELEDGSKVVIENGEFIAYDKHGNVVRNVSKQELSVTDRVRSAEEREFAGVSTASRNSPASAPAGGNLPPQASHATPSGHGGGDAPPRTGETPSGAGVAHSAGPETGTSGAGTVGNGHAGTGSGGHGSQHVPEAPAGHDVPTGSGEHTPAHAGATGAADVSRNPLDEIAPERYSRTSEAAGPPSEPMRPEQEAGLVEELNRAKISPQDQARVIRTLSKEPYGAEVADLISRGHLGGVKNYDEILKMCKQGASKANKSMIPAAYMALSHATELQSRGFSHLAFELKDDVTGLDLDVTTLHADGTPHYGYQLKDVDNIEGIKSAAKKAATQLKGGTADAKIAILDVHQSVADLNAKMFKEAEFQARRAGATFHLRFNDGSITVPPNGPVFP